MPQSFYGSQRNYRRRQNIKRILVIIAAVAVGTGIFALYNGKGGAGRVQKRHIYEAWQAADYARVYTLTSTELEKSPVDFFLLATNGFAAYQLAIAQINAEETQRYIDACIWSLRKTQLRKEGKNDARVSYVLGKAYYYKGLPFMDLSIEYLEEARAADYGASDIDEYLGLCYAALKDYENSVAAFSRALKPVGNEERLSGSDIFLLAIARSYFHLGELSPAKAYSTRALEISRDYKTVVSAR
ncbi:MAG: hypothetical protein LBG72_04440, partial [Spirochaetaceae bacterium]|nr:hypothetical protein [Spirochaetaceae bacterium]